jgi:hypothetical protein
LDQFNNVNFALARLQNLLPWAMPLNLGGGGVNAHQLKRDPKCLAIGKSNFQSLALPVEGQGLW